MKNIKFNFKEWSVPLALLILCILSFGLLIPSLGFYWDDWEGILVSDQFNLSEFWTYFSGNRPLAAWTHIVLTPILGVKPLNWHLYTLFIRWLTIYLMWTSFCKIWPNHKRQVTYAAFLFTVYPIFIQQPISVAYHQHWTAFALFFVSLLTMILSIQKPRYYWLFTGIALISLFLDISIIEYTLGLELLRPVIIWIISPPDTKQSLKKRIGFVISRWLPYILLIGGFTYWRISYTIQASVDPNKPTLLLSLFSQPLKTIIDLVQIVLQDTLFILVSSWYKTLEPDLIQIRQPFNILSWGLVVLVAFALYIYLSNLKFDQTQNDKSNKWYLQAFLFALAATLFGALPIWSTYRQASGDGLFVDRFAMISMFGASILLVVAFDWIVHDTKRVLLILSILIGISSGLHFRNANDYRWSWIKQQRVYWQLYWRAPAIEPDTSIMSFEQLAPFVSPTFSFNLLYDQPDNQRNFPYWYYSLGQFSNDLPGLVEGKEIDAEHREFTYSASSKNSLVILYDPPFTNCLWVLNEEHASEPYLPDLTQKALPLSNPGRILDVPQSADYPSTDIFGKEPQPNWCYYYEKAELAKQFEDWESLRALGDTTLEKGYSPQNLEANSPHEWIPFIEGFAYTGDLENAKNITIESYGVDSNYNVALCNVWIRVSNNKPGNEDIENASKEMFDYLGCNPK